ncbi:MAG: hypothetical protein BWY87_00961 [Deltaproteobacteria bacterium ADurb.Bin510]|nr:MAG: hypothetical protein BWY87_00961 [Deltaproteobacteria bacterium ADurb.Bin510]
MQRFLVTLWLVVALGGCSPREAQEPASNSATTGDGAAALPLVPVTPQQVGRQVDASMQQEQRQLERRVETATAEP